MCKMLDPLSRMSLDKHNIPSAKTIRSEHLAVASSSSPVAPYCALPVAGPVLITQNKATALPIIEPSDDMTDEVNGDVVRLRGAPYAGGGGEGAEVNGRIFPVTPQR